MFSLMRGAFKSNLRTSEWAGVANDIKPSGVENGSKFTEIDTGTKFMYDAANDDWYENTEA